MAVTETPIFPQTVVNEIQKIENADGTSLKTLITAGADGTRIDAIILTSTDTSHRDLQLFITISGTDYLLATTTVQANSGNSNTIPSINLLASFNMVSLAVEANGNKVLFLKSGAILKIKTTTTVTAAKEVVALVVGGNF